VRVTAVADAAARAGLREGDVILAVGNTEVANVREFEAAVAKADKASRSTCWCAWRHGAVRAGSGGALKEAGSAPKTPGKVEFDGFAAAGEPARRLARVRRAPAHVDQAPGAQMKFGKIEPDVHAFRHITAVEPTMRKAPCFFTRCARSNHSLFTALVRKLWISC
jgi:membrane-associated protease RseP (regulator of RpoE activity)